MEKHRKRRLTALKNTFILDVLTVSNFSPDDLTNFPFRLKALFVLKKAGFLRFLKLGKILKY